MNEHLEQDGAAVEALLRQSRWTGGPVFTGALPVIPERDALPTAAADFAYAIVAVPGTPTVFYACGQDSAGDWEWVELGSGSTV